MLDQFEYQQLLARFDSGILNLFIMVAMGCVALYPARNLLRRFSIPLGFRMSLFLTIIIAFALRIPHMTQSLWYDETFSAGIAQMSLDNLWIAVKGDVHPPIYYLILWATGNLLGYDEWALRLPSLIMGLVSIWVMFHLVWKLTRSRKHAQTSALILAILPAHIQYSTEARGYMLLTLLILIAVYALIETKSWLFALSTMVIPLVHSYGYIYFGVIATLWIIQVGRDKRSLAIIPACLSALAWFPFMIHQSQLVNDFWVAFTWQGIPKYLLQMTVGDLEGQLSMVGVYLPVTGLTILSIWNNRKWLVSQRGIALFGVMFGVPLVVAFISIVWQPIYLSRALLPCAILSIVLWVMLLDNPSPMRKFYRSVFIPALLLSTVMTTFTGVERDIREFFTACDHSDYVYSTSTATGIMALYYAPAPVRLWIQANDTNQYLSPEAKQAFGFIEADIEDLSGVVCVPMQINPHVVNTNQIPELREILRNPHDSFLMRADLPISYFVIFKVYL